MRILRMTFIEVGDMAAQHRRPFVMSIDGDMEENYIRMAHESGGRINRSMFNNELSGMVAADHMSEAIGSNQYWAARRFRVLMEIEIEGYSEYQSVSTSAILTGYTDGSSFSMATNAIDPQTQIRFNSIAMVKRTLMRDRAGIETENTQLISSLQLVPASVNIDNAQHDVMIRPYDIFNNLDIRDQIGANEDFIDSRSIRDHDATTADRRNSDSAHYINMLINKDIEASDMHDTYGEDFSDGTRNTDGASLSRSVNIMRDSVLRTFCNIRETFIVDLVMSYEDLAGITNYKSLDELDSLTLVAPLDVNRMHNDSVSNDWHGASPDTMAAIDVCHTVPSIMLDCLFDSTHFIVSNQEGYTTEPNFELINLSSYIGESFNDHRLVDIFAQRVINEIFRRISCNGNIGVTLEVDCDGAGFTKILISIDGSPMTQYSFPSFSDSVLSPIVTKDKTRAGSIADKFSTIRDIAIAERRISSQPQHDAYGGF